MKATSWDVGTACWEGDRGTEGRRTTPQLGATSSCCSRLSLLLGLSFLLAAACAPCPPNSRTLAGVTTCTCDSLVDDFAPDDLDDESSACAAVSSWSEPLRLRFEKRCDLHQAKYTPTCTFRIAERRALGCPCGALDGLHFKYGRTNAQDYDLYDIKPRCAAKTGQWARLLFRARERFSSASLACAADEAITGVRVTYARYEWGDSDEYDFRLQCSGSWQANGTALHPVRRRRPSAVDTAAVECAPGSAACGIEMVRARQEDGDVDLLDLRLRCFPIGGQAVGAASGESLDDSDERAAHSMPTPESEPEQTAPGEQSATEAPIGSTAERDEL